MYKIVRESVSFFQQKGELIMSEVKIVKRVTGNVGRQQMFTDEQQLAIADLFREVGTANRVKEVLAAENGDDCKLRDNKLFPNPVTVSVGTLYKVAERQGVKLVRGSGRQSVELSPQLKKQCLKVLKVAGNATSALLQLQNDGVHVSYNKLLELANSSGMVLKRGKQSKFTNEQKTKIVQMMAEYASISHVHRILKAKEGELSELRDKKLFPEPVKVAIPTLSKIKNDAGLVFRYLGHGDIEVTFLKEVA